jgi:DNA-directed RNA polymerase subunit RPC12/RpoP
LAAGVDHNCISVNCGRCGKPFAVDVRELGEKFTIECGSCSPRDFSPAIVELGQSCGTGGLAPSIRTLLLCSLERRPPIRD